MSFVSIRATTSHLRDMVLEDRMKCISAVMTQHDAKPALYKVVAGDGAVRYDLQSGTLL